MKLSILLLSSQNPYASSWIKRTEKSQMLAVRISWATGRVTSIRIRISRMLGLIRHTSLLTIWLLVVLIKTITQEHALCMCYPAYRDDGNAESEAKTFICTMLHSFEFPRLPPFSDYTLAIFLLHTNNISVMFM